MRICVIIVLHLYIILFFQNIRNENESHIDYLLDLTIHDSLFWVRWKAKGKERASVSEERRSLKA